MTCAIWDSRHSSTTSGEAASSTHTAALRAGPPPARLTSSPSARQAAWEEADHDDRQPEDGDLGDDLRPHARDQRAGGADQRRPEQRTEQTAGAADENGQECRDEEADTHLRIDPHE